jgi:hypothetical protein
MEKEWGADAMVFRPERWIERATATGKPVQQCVSQYTYIHFNAGKNIVFAFVGLFGWLANRNVTMYGHCRSSIMFG